jgi:hypothetical protein
MTRTKYFHEDDYCQQKLLPITVWRHCADELQRIGAFSDAHRTDNGWTDIYLRPGPPQSLRTLGIRASSVALAVSPILPSYQRVTTGYSSHVEECPATRAFGRDDSATLFFDEDASGVITACWIDPWTAVAGAPAFAQALSGLPLATEMLLVDWA